MSFNTIYIAGLLPILVLTLMLSSVLLALTRPLVHAPLKYGAKSRIKYIGVACMWWG